MQKSQKMKKDGQDRETKSRSTERRDEEGKEKTKNEKTERTEVGQTEHVTVTGLSCANNELEERKPSISAKMIIARLCESIIIATKCRFPETEEKEGQNKKRNKESKELRLFSITFSSRSRCSPASHFSSLSAFVLPCFLAICLIDFQSVLLPFFLSNLWLRSSLVMSSLCH